MLLCTPTAKSSVEPVAKGKGTAVGLYEKLKPILAALHAEGLTVIAVVTNNAYNLFCLSFHFKYFISSRLTVEVDQ